jgi:hypothetical protein
VCGKTKPSPSLQVLTCPSPTSSLLKKGSNLKRPTQVSICPDTSTTNKVRLFWCVGKLRRMKHRGSVFPLSDKRGAEDKRKLEEVRTTSPDNNSSSMAKTDRLDMQGGLLCFLKDSPLKIIKVSTCIPIRIFLITLRKKNCRVWKKIKKDDTNVGL